MKKTLLIMALLLGIAAVNVQSANAFDPLANTKNAVQSDINNVKNAPKNAVDAQKAKVKQQQNAQKAKINAQKAKVKQQQEAQKAKVNNKKNQANTVRKDLNTLFSK